jgi:hypothetical protein
MTGGRAARVTVTLTTKSDGLLDTESESVPPRVTSL